MAIPQVQPAGDTVLSGLRKLKMASLLQIVATVLVGVPALILMGSLFSFNIRAIIAAGLLWFVLLFVGMILAIIGIYAFLLPSAKQFALQNPEKFSTPSKLMKIGYLGGAILMLLGLLIIIAGIASITMARSPEAALGSLAAMGTAILGGLALAGIGGILFIIGLIGVIIYFLGLKDMFNSTLFLVAAILLIISIFISIVGFVAWILVFIETNSLEKNPPPPPPPPPPP
jgi:hypothetical protein